MSKKKTIVKRLSAIQTFGQMNILCTDKTGTLTEDEVVLEKYMDVYGNESLRILRHAFLNSYFQTGLKNLMDVAIIARAEKENLNILKEKYKREDEIPFDFSRRRMSVVLKDDSGKRQLITKGAVDEILSICSFIDIEGQAFELTDELRKTSYEVYKNNNQDGLRVLAVAQKNEIHSVETFGVQDESNMVLIGFVAFLDPPKESAKQAISALKNHGVDTVVLTGDTEGVALKVCEKVGITVNNSLTGKQIEELSDTSYLVGTSITHFYPLCVEKGRGEVRPVNAKVLHWFTLSGNEVFSMYSSPAPPRPFVKPAYEQTQSEAQDIIQKSIFNQTIQ